MSLGAWEKFQLGWLDYDVVRAGNNSEHKLRPNSADGRRNDGLIVLLPNKHVQLELGDPCGTCGERYFFSDSGNDIETTMTRAVDGGGALTAKVRYEIEEAFDYAFLEASDDGGETWTPVDTNLSYTGEDQSGFDPTGVGITGTSNGVWLDLTATLPAGTDTVRFRYITDGAVVGAGFQVDEIAIDAEPIGTAEVPEGWEFDGFRITTGSEDQAFLNAYVVDNRQYVGNDRLLSHVYNIDAFLDTRPDWVEFYHYEPGMLVNYWDTSHTDNNVGDHPGEGEVLPVDAHPTFSHTPNGALARPRILTYDSTFGLGPTSGLRLHFDSEPYRIPREPAVAVFNDTREYWYDFDEHGTPHPGRFQPGWYSVNVPESGTKIRVLNVNRNGVMTVRVGAVR
jgi:immune inhibitor A